MPSVGLNTTTTNHIQTQATKNAATEQAATKKNQGVMGKDDFLKLFLTSLQYQDPFNSMDMNQMMNQMSQMSIMEQVQNMTEAVDTLKATMQMTALDGGMKFLGKYVRGVDGEGKEVVGQVDTVRLAANNQVQLVIGERIVPLQFVESVSDQEIIVEKPEEEKEENNEDVTEVTNS
ncbi:flagellar basal body rod modification protein [Bacillus manliponensis]|uniref:Flagellar basal body rod modification protein n=1 Tax=Bacillus manliponensis TaxID=574376 RepID=A0A073K255_9BACI|nr:flagellar hook capping FlgD N-terminal domain-containing protein [Bacillus manliponensis]KEK20641.1 flagellar basal body rod modification protein [Bacillus manliponensis]